MFSSSWMVQIVIVPSENYMYRKKKNTHPTVYIKINYYKNIKIGVEYSVLQHQHYVSSVYMCAGLEKLK